MIWNSCKKRGYRCSTSRIWLENSDLGLCEQCGRFIKFNGRLSKIERLQLWYRTFFSKSCFACRVNQAIDSPDMRNHSWRCRINMKPYIAGTKIRVGMKIIVMWCKLFSEDIFNHPYKMTFRFSTSIQNFADRVKLKHDEYIWSFKKSLFDPTAFIGLYHEGDVIRVLLHRGPRLVFWCGGDVLWLQKHPFWQWLLRQVKIDHVCENEVECMALAKMRISARIHPILFFDDVNKYKLSFKPSKKPHVWLTCHPGREREYGVELVEEIADKVPEVTFHIFGINPKVYVLPPNARLAKIASKNIIYHGQVSSEEMDKMIRGYHCGLRTLSFDGCPHTVTKGILLGQYPINLIKYPHTESYETKEELIKLLKNLKNKTKPNLAGRKHWLSVVSEFPWQ